MIDKDIYIFTPKEIEIENIAKKVEFYAEGKLVKKNKYF